MLQSSFSDPPKRPCTQRRRSDNINNICILEGSGRAKFQNVFQKHCFSWELPWQLNMESPQILLSDILLSFRRLPLHKHRMEVSK